MCLPKTWNKRNREITFKKYRSFWQLRASGKIFPKYCTEKKEHCLYEYHYLYEYHCHYKYYCLYDYYCRYEYY